MVQELHERLYDEMDEIPNTLLRVWGISEAQYNQIMDAFVNGFELSNITIIPLRILSALLLFPILMMLTRFIRHSISVRKEIGMGRGMQNAFASLVGYVGFTIAFLVSLLLGGANLSGLALIAGALSIGIGFGLQNIVGNFISGLILLLERPIRPGDRIQVGDVEGWVESINIRSTTIRSLDRADVIIPNLSLITSPVSNLMFGNDNTRLRFYFYVAYGSDTKLVSEILLRIAMNHPEIINNNEIKPMVLFNKFTDNALEFELRIIIKDVNLRQTVRSELHFAIDSAFRENHIQIPFEQRDIYIRAWPKGPMNPLTSNDS